MQETHKKFDKTLAKNKDLRGEIGNTFNPFYQNLIKDNFQKERFMNDKIYYNLESEISKNYQVVLGKRHNNKKLQEEQLKILKDVDLMFDVIKSEQTLLNKKFREVLEDEDKNLEKKQNMRNLGRVEDKKSESNTAGRKRDIDTPYEFIMSRCSLY